MAEPNRKLTRLKEEALAAVTSFMASRPGTMKLDGGALARGEIAGWRTTLSVTGTAVPVRIGLDVEFPFSAPRVYLEGGPFFLRYPHVDEGEKLCLNPSSTTYSPARPVDVLTATIADAEQLLADSIAGRNRDDFAREFQNYWIEYRKNEEAPVWSLLRQFDRTRIVSYWAGADFQVVGESPEEVSAWLDRAFPHGQDRKRTIHDTLYVALKKPLMPEDYPRTNGDFRRLATAVEPQCDELLCQIAPQESRSLYVVFGFAGAGGPVLAGLRLTDPVAPSTSNWTKTRPTKAHGFRKGHIPPAQLLSRYYSNAPAVPLAVQRVDSPWLLQRGSAGFDAALAGKSVGVVGCGSLGAEIALQLAKSGVGRLWLVDNQAFSWDNVGRHVLPGRYAGLAKDRALKQLLEEQMPDLAIETGGGWSVQKVLRERRSFAELDLIVSTAGDWATESYLNAVARMARIFPSIVFGWTEPYGLAGHALAVRASGGCLACGCTETGLFARRVTAWPAGRSLMVQATGCGDLFQPYGTIDVAPIRAMIAETCLKALRQEIATSTLWSWMGDRSRLKALGGALTPEWEKRVTSDWCRYESEWPVAKGCPLCGT